MFTHVPTPKEEKRKISLEEDFMKWRTNDLLYGELLYMASITPDKTLYVTKDVFLSMKDKIMETCEYSSVKSLYNNLDRLIKARLIKEDKIDFSSFGKKSTAAGAAEKLKDAYIFLYDENNRYQFIQREMVYYLKSTRNKNSLRVYTYLLNKFLWKRQNKLPYYEFTLTELRRAFHYESKTAPDKAIRLILESFYREGLIDYSCDFVTKRDPITGASVPSPVFRLTNVVYYVEDLPPVPTHRARVPSHSKK